MTCGVGAFVALFVALSAAGATDARNSSPPRIVSINLCTDQLLLTLADPDQIAGLSPYARDPAQSWRAAEAASFPRLSGEAEDVLAAKPDIVLAGNFTKRATREFLTAHGLRVEEFDAALSIDDIEAQVRRMGDVVGHPERAAREVARIDAAVARARVAVARRPLRVLDLSRRGWASGQQSLTSSLLATIGLSNAARDLNGRFGDFNYGGFASLEAILSIRPDVLLLSEPGDQAEDQGRAFLMHPALEQLYPPSKRMVLAERLTTCGGPMITEALERLVAEVERVAR
jgi:iron complex transport system substrate-binding protein